MSPTNSAFAFDKIMAKCTQDPVQAILRRYKDVDPKNILIQGSKGENVRTLLDAMDRGAIPREEVIDLIRRAEENGHQTIFYYRPRNRSIPTSVLDGSAIASAIMPGWERIEFPRWIEPTNGALPVDFRLDNYGNNVGWTLKFYKKRMIREVIEDAPTRDNKYWIKKWKLVPETSVVLVKLNQYNLLEIRVPLLGSMNATRECLTEAKTLIRNSRIMRYFVEMNFSHILTNMADALEDNSHIYRFHALRFDHDSGVKTIIASPETNLPLNEVEAARAAIRLMLGQQQPCRLLAVEWMPEASGEAFNSAFLTGIMHLDNHSVSFGSALSPEATDYVIYRLLEFV